MGPLCEIKCIILWLWQKYPPHGNNNKSQKTWTLRFLCNLYSGSAVNVPHDKIFNSLFKWNNRPGDKTVLVYCCRIGNFLTMSNPLWVGQWFFGQISITLSIQVTQLCIVVDKIWIYKYSFMLLNNSINHKLDVILSLLFLEKYMIFIKIKNFKVTLPVHFNPFSIRNDKWI